MGVTSLHVLNWAVQLSFDAVVMYYWGWRPLFYMVLCIFLAGGLHPCAGHFISEHHVFPFVPWSRLPALKRIAPEFYDNLAVCDSWIGVIWDYIVREDVGPYNRVKRKSTKED